MIQDDVQVVQRMFDRWRAGDVALEAFHEDIEWDSSLFPDGTVDRGHEGVRRFLRRWLGTWEEYAIDLEHLFAAGDYVVAFTRERGRGKGSDVPVELEATMLFTVRDGKIVRFRGYLDRAAALAAAGLSAAAAQELADSGRV
ncbi:MAG: nuclear transport factor 2 family protein [Solirubrobacterales bacterium]